MTQHESLIKLLNDNPQGVTTIDLVKHPILCAEYRARISEARGKGYSILAEKVKKNLYKYTLVATPQGFAFTNFQ